MCWGGGGGLQQPQIIGGKGGFRLFCNRNYEAPGLPPTVTIPIPMVGGWGGGGVHFNSFVHDEAPPLFPKETKSRQPSGLLYNRSAIHNYTNTALVLHDEVNCNHVCMVVATSYNHLTL